jgi:hypothetical protein
MLLGRFGHPEFSGGGLQRMPVPILSGDDKRILADLFKRSWTLKRSADARNETSHAFLLPQLLLVDGDNLASRAAASSEQLAALEKELLLIQLEIDQRGYNLYGLSESDQQALAEGFRLGSEDVEPSVSDATTDEEDESDEGEEREAAPGENVSNLVEALVSWAVGVAFGRFDVRLAIGPLKVPSDPAPFDPLPKCSPGMLTGVTHSTVPAYSGGTRLVFPRTASLLTTQDITAIWLERCAGCLT